MCCGQIGLRWDLLLAGEGVAALFLCIGVSGEPLVSFVLYPNALQGGPLRRIHMGWTERCIPKRLL